MDLASFFPCRTIVSGDASAAANARSMRRAIAPGVYTLSAPFARPGHSSFGSASRGVGRSYASRWVSTSRAKHEPIVKTREPGRSANDGRTTGYTLRASSGGNGCLVLLSLNRRG